MVFMDTKYEAAWAAGFFDGEGCFSVRYDYKKGKRGNPAPIIAISQIDPRVLERFKKAVGAGHGSIIKVDASHNRSYTKGYIHRYALVGKRVVEAASKMWPFLDEVKKEQWRRVAKKVESERIPSNHGRQRDYTCELAEYRET